MSADEQPQAHRPKDLEAFRGLDPYLPAEAIDPELLRLIIPKESENRLATASALIELAISTQDEQYFGSAYRVIERNVNHRNNVTARAKALPYRAYFPLFIARAERRAPDEAEVSQAARSLYRALPKYHNLLEMPDEQLQAIVGPRKHLKGIWHSVQGTSAEAVVLYSTLRNARRGKGDMHYLASFREDSPRDEIYQLYGNHNHDTYAYDAETGTKKGMLSIKATGEDDEHGNQRIRPINLRVIAREVEAEIKQAELHKVSRPKMQRILTWLWHAEQPHHPAKYRNFCNEFRDKLGDRIQRIQAGEG